jgi:hypothetical protein
MKIREKHALRKVLLQRITVIIMKLLSLKIREKHPHRKSFFLGESQG